MVELKSSQSELAESAKFHVDFALRSIYNGLERSEYTEDPDAGDFAQLSNIAKQVIDDYLSPHSPPPETDVFEIAKFGFTVAYKLSKPGLALSSTTSSRPNEWSSGYMSGDQLREMLEHASSEGEYRYELYKNGTANEIRRYVNDNGSSKRANHESG